MSTPILTTKLHIPNSSSNVIQRARLFETLDNGLGNKLILVSASAGFGKTTLVASWLDTIDYDVAWLSLEEADSNMTRFLRYFITTLQTIEPGIGQTGLPILETTQHPPVETVMTLLLNDVTACGHDLLIVLDDYHSIDAPEIDTALTFLVDHLPANMTLVITTREDPQLPLTKYRSRAMLTELRATDLRFTNDEMQIFLNEMMGLGLPTDAIMALESRTEGWIAGLQLAAISLQRQADKAQFIEAFTGSHRYIMDYLLEEVLNTQPENLRQFLLQTSILEHLNAELCEAITGQNNCQLILEDLERGNLFLIPLDDSRQWYRYHHLFSDVLHIYLQKQYPDEVVTLHKRASRWYIAQDKPLQAIHHAIASEDFILASELLESIWREMEMTYQTAIWFRWVSALPIDIVRQRPLLSHGYAYSMMMIGNLEATGEWLNNAEQGLKRAESERIGDENLLQTLLASISCARMYLAVSIGDVEATLSHAEKVLEQLIEGDEANRRQAIVIASLAHWSNGDVAVAEQQLSAFIAEMQGTKYLIDEIELVAVLADMRIALGKLYDAYRAYEQGLQLAEQLNKPDLSGIEDLHRGIAELYCEWHKLGQAEYHLQRATELGQQGIMMPDWKHRLNVSWARFKIVNGDYDGALTHLEEAQEHYIRSPLPLVRPISAVQARVWIQQGQLQKAQDWIRQQGLSVDDEISYLREYEAVTLVRLLLAQNRIRHASDSLQSASKLLEKLRQSAHNGKRHGNLIEILILQAQCLNEMDDQARALTYLEQAITLAEPEDYVRVFVNADEPVRILLEIVATQGIMSDYIQKLLKVFDTATTPPASSANQPQIDSLSERELEVLTLIAEGLSNREISERLFIALDTVKGHNRTIYQKLQVKKRTQAVARARELGLI